MPRTLRTITVGQLIDALEGEDRNARVIFSADYGDRGNTQQALPISGDIETVTISESAYSNSGFAIAETDEDDDVDMSGETFVVVR